MNGVELGDIKDSESLLHNNNGNNNDTQPSATRPKVNFALDEYGSDMEAHRRKRKGKKKRSAPLQHRKPNNKGPKAIKYVIVLAIPILVLVSLFMVILQSPTHDKGASPGAAPTGALYASGFNMMNNWGAYSPYFDHGAKFEGIESKQDSGVLLLPSQCRFKQVHVLHRHAERYPTEGASIGMKQVADKLKSMSEPPSKQLSWIDDWTYDMDTALLVPSGVGTEFQSGSDFWASHGRLLFNATEKGRLFYENELNAFGNGTKRPLPVLRATTQSRIETSARAWAAGFFGVYGNQPGSPKDDSELYRLVLIPELQGYNNTLAPYLACTVDRQDDSGKLKQVQWVDTYLADAAERLQILLPGYANLTASDVFNMQKICTFEHATFGNSGFCELFTETEWRGFEYAADLSFYTSSSYGSPIGAACGTGWLAELLARLETRLITEPQYGVNVSLTNNEQEFPLDQLFYLDMTHDSAIVSVLTALGLGFLNKDLPATHMPVPRSFIVSRLTPFGARLYVEVIECPGSEDQIRLKLNNRIVPLDSLSSCPKNKDGLCARSKFIKSLQDALNKIKYDEVCSRPEEKPVDPEETEGSN